MFKKMEFKFLKGGAVFGVNLFRGRLMGKDWEAEVKFELKLLKLQLYSCRSLIYSIHQRTSKGVSNVSLSLSMLSSKSTPTPHPRKLPNVASGVR